MTQLADTSSHVANFKRLRTEASADAIPWLDALRKTGITRFDAVGFPTTKHEEWRFTNVAPLARADYELAAPPAQGSAIEQATQFSFGTDAVSELVFVNGHYTPQLSRLGKLPRGVTVMSLPEALLKHDALIEKHLAQYADIDANPFVALNTGFVRDGALVHVPRNVTVEGPIHLLFVTVATGGPAVSHPRVLVLVEENAEVQLVESYVGSNFGSSSAAPGEPYWTNAVTEIVAAPDARIDHCKLQMEDRSAYHVATMQVRVDRGAKFVSHSASVGSKLTRNDLNVVMAGEHADATLNGLVILKGDQHVDNHTLLDHAMPNCPSHELYKHVLDDKSVGVFKGQIFVRPDAQKTDSKQTSKSLLLSENAIMHSQPALEIYADDVKCTHGSTTGPVDEDMVFYLRSRGVSLAAARHLLTYAFAADVTRRIKVAPVRSRLEDFMAAQHGLPQDLRITDAGTHDARAM